MEASFSSYNCTVFSHFFFFLNWLRMVYWEENDRQTSQFTGILCLLKSFSWIALQWANHNAIINKLTLIFGAEEVSVEFPIFYLISKQDKQNWKSVRSNTVCSISKHLVLSNASGCGCVISHCFSLLLWFVLNMQSFSEVKVLCVRKGKF